MLNPFRFQRWMQEAGKFNATTIIGFIYHSPNFIRLFWRLLHDSRVPFHLRAICWGAIFYALFPFDLIPDFPLLLIGRADDIALLIYAFRKLVKEAPEEIVREHVQAISNKTSPESGR